MNKRWMLVAALALAAACSDGDGGGGGDGDGDGDGDGEPAEIPAALSAALDDSRQSSRDVCAAVDACFPEGDETATCNYVVDGESVNLLREWPPAAADACWLPLYEKNAQATLAYVGCIQESGQAFEACLQGCPEDAELVACDEAVLDADGACIDEAGRQFTERELNAYLDCEERLASNPR